MFDTPLAISSRAADGVRARLGVWIDQDLCTGDGLCTDHAPQVFTILEDGIAYCVEDGSGGPGEVRRAAGEVKVFNDPGGSAELAMVPPSLEGDVIAAAAECPGECIFIELVDFDELEAGHTDP